MTKEFILMLEPNSVQRELYAESFTEKQIPFHFLNYSNEVMLFLTGALISRQTLPRVIVLALHSTPQNALFVLEEIKDNENFKHLPVIIIGENASDELIKRSYDLGANSFINETNGFNQKSKIESFLSYWFEISELAAKLKMSY